MAYSKGYEYDLFVSYATVDDIEQASSVGWVAAFVRDLENALASRLGGREKLRIYFDRRNLAGNHALEELLGAARRSALFLSIASPAYAQRDWTKKELDAFVTTGSDARRLFVAEYLPLDQGESHPAAFNQRKRLQFWERSDANSRVAMPIMAKEKLLPRIHDLAHQIKEQLQAINAAETARPAISHVAQVIASDAEKREKGIVYLAQTTDDLEDERLQVQRFLEQFGYLVLPEADLPGGGDAFIAAVQAAIGQAHIYIHLLGPRSGRSPSDLPDGYAATQVHMAEGAGKDMLLWRHPELDVEAVTDARQKALLSNRHVIAGGLQQFMEEARRRLQNRKSTSSPAATPSLVFINAIRNDHHVARVVQEEFAARDMSAAIPLYDGSSKEIEEDLKENMRDCDVMVLIYGEAPPSWIRGQMRYFNKIRPGPCTKVIAIFEGPPDQKPSDIGFTLPGLRHIRFPDGWTAEQVRRVIAEISQ